MKKKFVSCFDIREVPKSPAKWNWNWLYFLPFIFTFEKGETSRKFWASGSSIVFFLHLFHEFSRAKFTKTLGKPLEIYAPISEFWLQISHQVGFKKAMSTAIWQQSV